jgi:transcriptional regulator with XRE-family HTH domain
VAEVFSLGERLKNRREELGISQAQAARELDVARTAYRLWEMEAASPSPDRWRLIARWLGVSVATMLLAENLIDDREADDAEAISRRVEATGRQWDAAAEADDDGSGDFFAEEQTTIARETASGVLSSQDSARLTGLLSRVERATKGNPGGNWRPAELLKGIPATIDAPAAARAAVLATATGVPMDRLLVAESLVSELVTNSVEHGSRGPQDDLHVHIVLSEHMLRVEVADSSSIGPRLRQPDETGGWGLRIVMELASRWGGGRYDGQNLTWFELDLPAPA